MNSYFNNQYYNNESNQNDRNRVGDEYYNFLRNIYDKNSFEQQQDFNNFLNNQQCEEIIKEILNQPKYDDKVMVNRNRIFKGSKNFDKILSKSPNMKNIYEYLNKFKTFNVLNNLFDHSKIQWKLNEKIFSFSDNYSGKQKDDLFEMIFFIIIPKHFFLLQFKPSL